MQQTRVVILNEVTNGSKGDWRLCFQYCRYEFGDGREQNGYRFIWTKPETSLQGARRQALLPSAADILELTASAIRAGWGNHLPTIGQNLAQEVSHD